MVGCGKGPEEEDGMVQEGALGEGLGRGEGIVDNWKGGMEFGKESIISPIFFDIWYVRNNSSSEAGSMRPVTPISRKESSDFTNGLPYVLESGEKVPFGTFSGTVKELRRSGYSEFRDTERCLTVFLSCSSSLWISAILL